MNPIARRVSAFFRHTSPPVHRLAGGRRTRRKVTRLAFMLLVPAAFPLVRAASAATQERHDQQRPPVVRVFLLAGQSNMEGQGAIRTLPWLGEDPDYGHLLKRWQNPDGTWRTRDDVYVYYPRARGGVKKGPLTVGFGANDERIGPELFFGDVVGDYFQEPVLLVKTAWGGKEPGEGVPATRRGRRSGAVLPGDDSHRPRGPGRPGFGRSRIERPSARPDRHGVVPGME